MKIDRFAPINFLSENIFKIGAGTGQKNQNKMKKHLSSWGIFGEE